MSPPVHRWVLSHKQYDPVGHYADAAEVPGGIALCSTELVPVLIGADWENPGEFGPPREYRCGPCIYQHLLLTGQIRVRTRTRTMGLIV